MFHLLQIRAIPMPIIMGHGGGGGRVEPLIGVFILLHIIWLLFVIVRCFMYSKAFSHRSRLIYAIGWTHDDGMFMNLFSMMMVIMDVCVALIWGGTLIADKFL